MEKKTDLTKAYTAGESILNTVNEIERCMWALHHKLGQAYDGREEQIADAIKLGELAKAIQSIRNGAWILLRETCPRTS